MSEERKKILTMLADGKITVDEAEELLAALAGRSEPAADRGEGDAGKGPKYLRVVVQNTTGGENVNIRVPLALIRAGIKLGSIIPAEAHAKIHSALKDKGIDINLPRPDPDTVEQMIASLCDLSVDVSGGKGETVRVFSE